MNVLVTVKRLNIRSKPGTSFPIAGTAGEGDVLTLKSDERPVVDGYTWLHVDRGWVAAEYTMPASDEPFRFEVWPTEFRTITQRYGNNYKYYFENFGLPGHEGVDIRAPHGSKIFAVAAGQVSKVFTDPRPKKKGGHNYGIHVRILHAEGYETISAHLQEALVAAGDGVKGGDLIGLADNTGNSFGDHLHLTLKQGKRIIDPTRFLEPFLEVVG